MGFLLLVILMSANQTNITMSLQTGVSNTISSVANKIISRVENFAPFGKFERITAGFCMAIPFFLMIADPSGGSTTLWLLTIPAAIVVLPQLIRIKKEEATGVGGEQDAKERRSNYGMFITLGGAGALLILYFLFTQIVGIHSKPSISDYVTMDGAHIFGMLLTIAAMLFMSSGVVFWNKKITFREGTWRSVLNLILGLLLLGVVIFPCTTMPTMHMIVAIAFFFGCAIGTLGRKAKDKKRRFVDYAAVLVMAFAMFCHFAVAGEWFNCAFCRRPFNLFNLFGAESIALWITGLDFILVSLKRELNDQDERKTKMQPQTLDELLKGGSTLKH